MSRVALIYLAWENVIGRALEEVGRPIGDLRRL